MYYEPDHSLGTRIIAQQSVFVIFNPLESNQQVDLVEVVTVPQSLKIELQKYLKSIGYSQKSLFKDIPGLAMANTRQIPLQPKQLKPIDPKEYRDRGNLAFQNGRYEDALVAYEAYAKALPDDVAQPYCLKGDTLAALARFEEADIAYTMATERLDKPIDFGKEVIVNLDVVVPMMSRALYYNRGNVRAAIDRHEGAVKDFEKAIEIGFKPKYDVLVNLGNSKFALQKYEEAYFDFEKASLERKRSDLALAMGNCKMMLDDFDEALKYYIDGSNTVPEEPTTEDCRKNAEQVSQILKILNGQEHEVKRSCKELFIEVVDFKGELGSFSFMGNRGNTGNFPSGMITGPGGKGYKSMGEFVVKIVDSTAVYHPNVE